MQDNALVQQVTMISVRKWNVVEANRRVKTQQATIPNYFEVQEGGISWTPWRAYALGGGVPRSLGGRRTPRRPWRRRRSGAGGGGGQGRVVLRQGRVAGAAAGTRRRRRRQGRTWAGGGDSTGGGDDSESSEEGRRRGGDGRKRWNKLELGRRCGLLRVGPYHGPFSN
jgi:hypothetical protein